MASDGEKIIMRHLRKVEDTSDGTGPCPIRHSWIVYPLLVGLTIAAFCSVVRNDFVVFDDSTSIINNPFVRQGLNPQSIRWAFTTMLTANWQPLTWLSHMLDGQLFGLRPSAHHLMNLLLHILNVLLLYTALKKMTGAILPSAFTTALFAIHPLHVESIAWASERKDVLCALFWFLTMHAYVRFTRQRTLSNSLLVLLPFLLGLMSKPMIVTLPFSLLLLDIWPLERIGRHAPNATSLPQLLIEKTPLFLCSALACVVTFIAQKSSGAVRALDTIPLFPRLANAAQSYLLYLVKTFWPVHLSVFYPYAPISSPMAIGTLFVLTFITITAIAMFRKAPYFLMGWLWYLGTLVPVIGLIQVGEQAMADRYTYIPLIGIFIMISWGCADLFGHLIIHLSARNKRWSVVFDRDVLLTTACFLVLLLALLTGRQVLAWRNTGSLFSHAIAVTRNNYVAHTILGIHLARNGDPEAAIEQYAQALRIKPDHTAALNNWGMALAQQSKYDEAIQRFGAALAIEPFHLEANMNLAMALSDVGRTDLAEAQYRKVIRFAPNHKNAHFFLGELLLRKGIHEESLYEFNRVLELDPFNSATHNNIAWILSTSSDPMIINAERALSHARRAMELSPTPNTSLLDTLAAAFAVAGRYPEALDAIDRALSLAASSGQEQQLKELSLHKACYEAKTPLVISQVPRKD